MTSITVSTQLHDLVSQIRKHYKDVSTITTMKFLLIGGVVKRIQDEKLIPAGVSESSYFVENTGIPYSTLNHSRNCLETWGDVVIPGSGLEDIGPSKLIRFLPVAREMNTEQKADLLKQIKPLSGSDARIRYLEMKGESVEEHSCTEWQIVEKETCKVCGKEKARKDITKKTYKMSR